MFFKYILLTSQQKIQSERTVSAVYYLMQGKQSIQTIQDAHLFGLHSFYGIYKSIEKSFYFNSIDQLMKEKYIKEVSKDYFEVTNIGEEWLYENKAIDQKLYLNGFTYGRMDHIYFSRILLLIQVWTNSMKSHNKYIPMIESKEVEQWVKMHYQHSKHNLDYYLKSLYKELVTLLSLFPEDHAEIFVHQITSYQSIAMTMDQLAQHYQTSKSDIHIITMNIIHFILEEVNKSKKEYPLLSSISTDLNEKEIITDSAEKTMKLLATGLSLLQISRHRQLKLNTIYDHVVEIALNDPHFSIIQYVNESAQQQIKQAVSHLKSYKLKDIKEIVSEEITYFQIRLVLAKTNDLDSRGDKNESRT